MSTVRKRRKKLQITKNNVYNGDSLKLVKYIKDNSIDLIITDPPYELDIKDGVKECSIHSIQKHNDKEFLAMCSGFDIDVYLKEWSRVLKKINMFIFCSSQQISSLMKWGEDRNYLVTLLTWWKYNSVPFSNGVYRPDTEYIVHIRERGATFQGSAKIKSKVFRIPTEVSRFNHPTEKPIFFYKRFLELCSNEGDLVLDPFGGSGTLASACIDMGRDYILFEKNKKHFETIKERIELCSSTWEY